MRKLDITRRPTCHRAHHDKTSSPSERAYRVPIGGLSGQLTVLAMALAVPPPNDKKRVKVYELRNNDWFDRGTGFCTGQIVNVRHASLTCIQGGIRSCASKNACPSGCVRLLTELMRSYRMNRVYMLSRRISRSACCWRPGLAKMMVTRNSKVSWAELLEAGTSADGLQIR